MSNFRVRQVLALGPLPASQLRLLVALATWMNDDERTVRLGMDALIRTTGNARNTVRLARDHAATAGRLAWQQPKQGRGHLTLWTVLCLPEKGGSDVDPYPAPLKGVSDVDPLSAGERGQPAREKGLSRPEKRGQAQPDDVQGSDNGLNRLANPSGSLSPAARTLANAVPGASEREIRFVVDEMETRRRRGEIKNLTAYVRKIIDKGDAPGLIDDARTRLAEADERAERQRRLAEADPAAAPPAWTPDPARPARIDAAKRLALEDMRAALGMPNGASANGSEPRAGQASRPPASGVSDDQAGADRAALGLLSGERQAALLAEATRRLGTGAHNSDLIHAAAQLAAAKDEQ